MSKGKRQRERRERRAAKLTVVEGGKRSGKTAELEDAVKEVNHARVEAATPPYFVDKQDFLRRRNGSVVGHLSEVAPRLWAMIELHKRNAERIYRQGRWAR